MSKVIVLGHDVIINKVPYEAKQRVIVPDNYGEEGHRVVARHIGQRNRQRVEAAKEQVAQQDASRLFRRALQRLNAILQAEHPQFWQALQNRPAVQDAIIAEMREDPDILRRALDDPQWFVDEVRERLQGQTNGGGR